MKKICYLVFTIICFFIIAHINVKAAVWQCPYKYDNGDRYIYEFDNVQGTVKITNPKTDHTEWIFNDYSYTYNVVTQEDEVKSYQDNFCPILFLVYKETVTSSCSDAATPICWYDYHYTYVTYTDSYIREQRPNECVLQRDNFCLENFLLGLGFSNTTSYFQGKLDKDDPLSEGKESYSICPSWQRLESQLVEQYKKYNESSDNNRVQYIHNANSIIDKLKVVCNSILSYRDVQIESSTEIIKDACIEMCLNLGENVSKIKKDYGIKSNSDNRVCGFSERLFVWASNILRWIKYILPVAVIIFGILDFIKAIGADKDDEMKKAQKRFVIRLIAAALVFIIPLILEFILDKMGFGYNDCGLF